MTFNIVQELRNEPEQLIDMLCNIVDVEINQDKRNMLLDIIKQLPEKASLKTLIDAINAQEQEELLKVRNEFHKLMIKGEFSEYFN